MTNTVEVSIAEIAIERLEFSRRNLLALVESLSDEQLLVRAGDSGNHAIWVMGHIAFSDEFLRTSITEEAMQLPESYSQLFKNRTIPTSNPSIYPNREELLHHLEQTRIRTIEWINDLDGEAGLKTVPVELQAVAPNVMTIPFTIIGHENFHTGQIATVRVSLGLAPIFA